KSPQAHRRQYSGDVFAQVLSVGLGAMHEHDEIVRAADGPPRRQALDRAPAAQVAGVHRAAGLPRPVQVLIEHRHGNAEDQRRQDASLRGAGVSVLVASGFSENPALRNAFTSASTRLSLTLARTRS